MIAELSRFVREGRGRAVTAAVHRSVVAQELWLELQEVARGVYLMPPFGRYETCAELLSAVEARKVRV